MGGIDLAAGTNERSADHVGVMSNISKLSISWSESTEVVRGRGGMPEFHNMVTSQAVSRDGVISSLIYR